jgi:uncharacterized protein (TIGR04141 family)
MSTGTPKPRTIEVSIRLLKRGTTTTSALKQDHDLAQEPSSVGTLYIGQRDAETPDWAKFLQSAAPSITNKLSNQSCAAILFVEDIASKPRLFAICFGQGHHALDSDRIERRFGLKVVLNSVSRNQLRTLDSATLDATLFQKRIQASRVSDLKEFGVDSNRELLRLASGLPDDRTFAKAAAGKDALHARIKVFPQDLPAFCTRALKLYQANAYKKDFGFIDHIEPEEDLSRIDELDNLAFSELGSLVAGSKSDLHLCIPEILTPESSFQISYYGACLRSGPKEAYSEVAIDDYVKELQQGDFSKLDMNSLRSSHEIRVVTDGEGEKSHKRKIYSCLVYEVKHRSKTYVLYDSQWYRISDGYFNDIENFYQRTLVPTSFLASTTCKNEKELIAELSKDPNLLCLDQTHSAPTGAKRELEACDFFSKSRQFIHLKDGHGSDSLSHLWNQALVSAESFIQDDGFRKTLREEVAARQRKYRQTGFLPLLPAATTRPNAADFPIIFGVMRRAYVGTGKLDIPFFSKVALRAVVSRLHIPNYSVELHLIEKK